MNAKLEIFLFLTTIWFNTANIVTASSGCQDQTADCQTLKQTVNICSDQFSAHNVCPLTCGMCAIQPTPLSTGCQDQLNDCSVLQQRVQICSNQASANNLCPMTCGICHPQINGGWSNWGPYTACSKSCNGGTKTRSRLCNNPTPSGGGSLCSGSYYESTYCNTQPCALPGGIGTGTSGSGIYIGTGNGGTGISSSISIGGTGTGTSSTGIFIGTGNGGTGSVPGGSGIYIGTGNGVAVTGTGIGGIGTGTGGSGFLFGNGGGIGIGTATGGTGTGIIFGRSLRNKRRRNGGTIPGKSFGNVGTNQVAPGKCC